MHGDVNQPPEGRRKKHNKPLIPTRPVTNNQQQRQAQVVPQNTSMPGPVAGMNIARRIVFQCTTTRNGWAFDMLIAIAAAKALGITQFELSVDGSPERPKQQQSGFFVIGGSSDEPWQVSASQVGICSITIYAVVVE